MLQNRMERRANKARLRNIRLDGNGLAEVSLAVTELKAALHARDAEIQGLVKAANDQVLALGSTTTETKNALAKQIELFQKQANDFNEVVNRMGALEQKIVNFKPANENVTSSPGLEFFNNANVKDFFKGDTIKRGRISAPVNTITSLTSGSGGAGDLIQPQRIPGIVEVPTRKLRIRDLLPVGRTNSNSLEFVQETGFTNAAAVVAEGATKPESTISFGLQTAPVRTIAHVMKASVQVLADVPQLQSFIDTRLRIGLAIEEEDQLLSGDGTGQNLLGLIPQATDFDVTRKQVGDTRIDIVRRAMTQLELAIYTATAIVMHPTDWEHIELTKESGTGAYVWANPRGMLAPTLWGLPVVTSTALSEGEFLVGAFNVAAQIWDRQQAVVEVSSEDEDNFRRNLVTIRGEERIALTVYRPESFIYGDFDDVVSS